MLRLSDEQMSQARSSDNLTTFLEQQINLLAQHSVDVVIVGGVAETLYGSEISSLELDVCYARTPENCQRLVNALHTVHARLRTLPNNQPFNLDADLLKRGQDLKLATDIGNLDLVAKVPGLGYYEDVLPRSIQYQLFGHRFPVIEVSQLVLAKRAAGRVKDLLVAAELEAILMQQKS